jgi:hypothetical protein
VKVPYDCIDQYLVCCQGTLHKQPSLENTSTKLVIDGASWRRGYSNIKEQTLRNLFRIKQSDHLHPSLLSTLSLSPICDGFLGKEKFPLCKTFENTYEPK